MGNRAILRAKDNKKKGVYLHWNGGRDSVEAFLKYCELRGFRDFNDAYGMARFCQVVGNFFGANGLSVGIIDLMEEENGELMDNGMYIVDGWKIVGRKGFKGEEQNDYDLVEMLQAIDKAQPENQQLGDYITAEEVKTSTLKIGDVVYMQETDGEYKEYTVVGIGEDKYVNGYNVENIPFVNRYMNNGDYSNNPNNYITSPTIKIATKENVLI